METFDFAMIKLDPTDSNSNLAAVALFAGQHLLSLTSSPGECAWFAYPHILHPIHVCHHPHPPHSSQHLLTCSREALAIVGQLSSLTERAKCSVKEKEKVTLNGNDLKTKITYNLNSSFLI